MNRVVGVPAKAVSEGVASRHVLQPNHKGGTIMVAATEYVTEEPIPGGWWRGGSVRNLKRLLPNQG